MGEAVRYRFGPRSTRGLLAGWRGGQIAWVAVAAVLALGSLRSIGGLGGAVVGLAIAACGAAAATLPVAGRTVESWAPTVGRFAAAQLDPAGNQPWRRRPPRRTILSPLRVGARPSESGGEIGVVEDQAARTVTAVLPVGGAGFALLDESGQASAVAAWSGVLASMATDHLGLHRLQWIARSLPGSVSGLDVALPATADRSYADLVSDTALRVWDREVLLAVTVMSAGGNGRLSLFPRREAPGAAGSAPDGSSPSLGNRRLNAVLASLTTRITAAGLSPGAPLDARALTLALRRAYELGPVAAAGTAVGAGTAFPIGVEARWASCRTDASWQAAYWIAEWPRGEVGPAVLLPLLVGTLVRHTVSLTLAPLPPERAVRRAERERTSGAADAELRRRHGYALTARARLEQATREERESELAAGHAGYLFSGYVSVTAPDEETLERSCTEVEHGAAMAQLDLRRLYGAQLEGWCCTLPTGRGCR